jgi:hypothetical protein
MSARLDVDAIRRQAEHLHASATDLRERLAKGERHLNRAFALWAEPSARGLLDVIAAGDITSPESSAALLEGAARAILDLIEDAEVEPEKVEQLRSVLAHAAALALAATLALGAATSDTAASWHRYNQRRARERWEEAA